MSDSGKRSKWDMPAQQQQESMTPSPIKDNERLKQLQTAVRRIHEKIQQPQLQSQQVSSSTGLVTQTFKPIVPETSSPSNLPYTIGSDNTFIKEIEINNVRNRYTLTKGATLSEIARETGATVTVKGRYYKEGEERGPNDEKPLYIHIAAESEEQLFKAVEKIEQIIKQTPNFLTAKIPVGIKNPEPGFNIAANIIGKGGINVKHITQVSGGTRVQLKGKGSGYKEPNENEESDEPMYLHLSSSNQQNLEKAKALAESLLKKVRQNYEKAIEQKKQQQQQREQQQMQPALSQEALYYQQYYGYPGYGAIPPMSGTLSGIPPGITPLGGIPPVAVPAVSPMTQYPQYYNYYGEASHPPPPAPGTITYSSTPPPPPGIISYTPPPPTMGAGYVAPPSGGVPEQSFISTKLSADSDAKKRKLNEDENSLEEKANKKAKSQNNEQTGNSSEYGGMTEQEYNYAQYYQNYYAQYYQQQEQQVGQPNYSDGQTVATQQQNPVDGKSNVQ